MSGRFPHGLRMRPNRSIPAAVVIPELAYRDVGEAVAWLCAAPGLAERLRSGAHRAQLNVPGAGALVVTDGGSAPVGDGFGCHRVRVRVADVDAHHRRAVAHGARILSPPTDYPFGERRYSLADPAGHRWVFPQSIADVDPAAWGGQLQP